MLNSALHVSTFADCIRYLWKVRFLLAAACWWKYRAIEFRVQKYRINYLIDFLQFIVATWDRYLILQKSWFRIILERFAQRLDFFKSFNTPDEKRIKNSFINLFAAIKEHFSQANIERKKIYLYEDSKSRLPKESFLRRPPNFHCKLETEV